MDTPRRQRRPPPAIPQLAALLEQPPVPRPGRYASRALRFTWNEQAIAISQTQADAEDDAPGTLRLGPGDIRTVQLSRSGDRQPTVHLELRTLTRRRVRLCAVVPDPRVVERLPHYEGRGTRVPFGVLINLLQAARFLDAEVARVAMPPAEQTPPSPPWPTLVPFEYRGRWGYRRPGAGEVVAPRYDAADAPSEGLARVRRGSGWGFVDLAGQEVIPLRHTAAGSCREGLVACRFGQRWSFLDRFGARATRSLWDDVWGCAEGRIGVRTGVGWGFVDRRWRAQGPAAFDEVGPFREGLARVAVHGAWGFAAADGKVFIRPRFERALDFSEGVAAVQRAQRMGFIDRFGADVIAPRYDWVFDFVDGQARVREPDGSWHTIDHRGRDLGEPAAPPRGLTFREGLARTESNGAFGFVGLDGTPAFDGHFVAATDFSAGLAGVGFPEGGWGFVDRQGLRLADVRFDEVRTWSEGRAAVRLADRWGFAGLTGELVVRPDFDEVGDFFEGLARVRVGAKWGFVDALGAWVIEPRYEGALDFREGLAPVMTKGRWGYVDGAGRLRIPARFEWALEFADGVALVETEEGWRWLLSSGTLLDPDPVDRP